MTLRRMVIVFWSFDEFSGAEVSALRLAGAIERQTGATLVVAAPEGAPVLEHAAAAGMETHGLPLRFYARKRPLPWLRGVRALARVARGADLVHFNGVISTDWLQAARMAGVPALVWLHDFEIADRTVARLRRHRPLLIAASEAVARTLAEEVGDVPVVTPALNLLPVVPEAIEPVDVRPPRADGDTVQAVLAGRIVRRKGAHDAIEACALLARRLGAPVELSFFGSVPDDGYRQELVALGEEHGVPLAWHGFSPLETVFSDCDVLLVPSHLEPFGMVAWEAVASGVPAAVTAVGGLADVAAMLGLPAAEPGNPESLADVAEAVLANPPTKAQRALAAEEFAPDRVAGAYLDLVSRNGRR